MFDWSPLWISVRTTLCAGVLVFLLGVGLARAFLYAGPRVKWLTDVLFTLPLVLPPTVVGFLLLVLTGHNSPVGRLLERLGLPLVFSWQATVIAAAVVSFPLMYRAAKGAFEQIDPDLVWAARTLGMTEGQIFLRVLVPRAWPGISAGAALSVARALGEFGATLMVAGNIPGRTQTIPVAIYFSVASGNLRAAAIWTAVITAVSCFALGLINRRSAQRGGAAG